MIDLIYNDPYDYSHVSFNSEFTPRTFIAGDGSNTIEYVAEDFFEIGDDKKLVSIKNELSYIANLYDLHMIEVLNIFNYSLIETYKLDKSHYLVNLTLNNQIIFYHMFEHTEILYNLSKEKFNTFYKVFHTNISKKSDINMVSLFYISLNKQKYTPN